MTFVQSGNSIRKSFETYAICHENVLGLNHVDSTVQLRNLVAQRSIFVQYVIQCLHHLPMICEGP